MPFFYTALRCGREPVQEVRLAFTEDRTETIKSSGAQAACIMEGGGAGKARR